MEDRSHEIEKDPGKISTKTIYYDEFKIWLNDTLISLNNWENQREKFVTAKKVIAGEDSLSLGVFCTYTFEYIKDKAYNEEIFGFLELLREYDELPKEKDDVSFESAMYFYPTGIDQRPFDFDSRIEKIKISNNDSNCYYSYIRGRISGKRVFKIDRSGKETLIRTVDF